MASALLSQLRAQDTALRTITFALESDRVHHAYLFVGPAGVGKELTAFGLAQALVCERRGEAAGPDLFGGGGAAPLAGACGECSACQRAVPREDTTLPVHPDITVLERGLYTPQQLGKKNAETQDISVEQVRKLVVARMAFPPHEGRAKVFIVRRAEELNLSAANALLKSLEEPNARTHFVLLSSQPEALLPTILSRTQQVRFAPLPDELVVELLAAKGVAPDRAKDAARLAGGSVELGLLLADPEESDARGSFVEGALAAVESPGIEAVLALAETAKKDKEGLVGKVAALASELAARAGEAARAGRPEAEAYAIRGRFALTALEHLAANGAAQLVVEAMLMRMRSV